MLLLDAVAVVADKQFYEGVAFAARVAAQGGDPLRYVSRAAPMPTEYKEALRTLRALARKEGDDW